MEKLGFKGNTFYIDDLTKELSRKYNASAYRAHFMTLGEANMESALGRFMFIARTVGQFVGVDFETYMKEFPNEQWHDHIFTVHREKDLERYASFAQEEALNAPPLRIETCEGRKIYFPTEPLIRVMLDGADFVSSEQFRTQN